MHGGFDNKRIFVVSLVSHSALGYPLSKVSQIDASWGRNATIRPDYDELQFGRTSHGVAWFKKKLRVFFFSPVSFFFSFLFDANPECEA